MAEDKIKIIIEVDADKASAAFKRAENAISAFDGTAKKAEASFSKLGATFISLNQGVEFATRIWGKFSGAIGGVLEAGGKFQKLKIQLEGVTGSAAKGEDAFAWLVKFNKETPLQLEDVTKAFVRLKAIGLDPTKGILQGVADAVAHFGGTSEEFNRAIIGMGQVAGKGVLSMEELRQQIGESIPSAIPILAKSLGITVPELFKQVADGAISSDVALEAWRKGFLEAYGGDSKRMMDTWPGAVSNLKDAWTLFLAAVADNGALQVATNIVLNLTAVINGLSNALSALSRGRKEMAEWSKNNADASGWFGGSSAGDVAAKQQEEQKQAVLNYVGVEVAAGKATKYLAEATYTLSSAMSQLEQTTTGMAGTFRNDLEKMLAVGQASFGGLSTAIELLGGKFGDGITLIPTWLDTLDDIPPVMVELVKEIKNVDSGFGDLGKSVKEIDWNHFNDGIIETKNATAAALVELDKFALSWDALNGKFESIRMVTQDILDMGDAFDKANNQVGGFVSGRRGDSGGGTADATSDRFFAGIGTQAAGQVAGVSGAIQGGMAAGPAGAAAGFFAELLMRNEKMRALLESINAVLISLLDPIADALAPSLEAIVPVLEALRPEFEIIGRVLKVYLSPTAAALTKLAPALDRLNAWGDKFAVRFGEDLEKFANVVVAPIKKLAENIDYLADQIKKIFGRQSGLIPQLPGQQQGGSILAGQRAMVGESGPEMFVPRVPGYIVPNHQLGGTNITITHPDGVRVAELVRRFMREEQFRMAH